jgi:hypothetical protein
MPRRLRRRAGRFRAAPETPPWPSRHAPTHSYALGQQINTDLTARTDEGPVLVVNNGSPTASTPIAGKIGQILLELV